MSVVPLFFFDNVRKAWATCSFILLMQCSYCSETTRPDFRPRNGLAIVELSRNNNYIASKRTSCPSLADIVEHFDKASTSSCYITLTILSLDFFARHNVWEKTRIVEKCFMRSDAHGTVRSTVENHRLGAIKCFEKALQTFVRPFKIFVWLGLWWPPACRARRWSNTSTQNSNSLVCESAWNLWYWRILCTCCSSERVAVAETLLRNDSFRSSTCVRILPPERTTSICNVVVELRTALSAEHSAKAD